MLTVEQVRSLDDKVRKALELIEALKSENSMLKGKLDEYKQRVDQLDSVVEGFKLEQLEIEEGIKDVLEQLDQLEDQITTPDNPSPVITENTINEIPKPAAAELSLESEPLIIEPAASEPRPEEIKSEPTTPEPPELEIF